MITLSRDGNRLIIHSDMPHRDKENIQRLPGSRYSLDEHRYWAPLTWATCRTLRGLFGDGLVISDDVIEWARHERETRIDQAMRMREALDIDSESGGYYDIIKSWRGTRKHDLYKFQEAGVAFMAFGQQVLLTDPMGTGKTAQTISAVRALYESGKNPFPVICVVPNNMMRTWQREISDLWWPGLSVAVVKGSAAVRRKILSEPHHVYIINYEGLRSHTRLRGYGDIRLKRCVKCDATLPDIKENAQSRCENCKKELNKIAWRTIIVDEAHKMQNPKSKQTRGLWALNTDETKFVFCLTGTPIGDQPAQLWPGLHLISKDEWPAKTRYVDRYCETSLSYAGLEITGLKAETRDEFYDIVYPRMRRMPKEIVLPHLPKKTYVSRYVEMSAKQGKAYDMMKDHLMTMLDDGSIIVAQNPLVQMTRLVQFACAYAELVEDERGEMHITLTDPSSKVDELLEILSELGSEPAVVFAKSRQLIDLAAKRLSKEGISYSLIVGGQSPDEREMEKMRFQEGMKRVCLCTYGAGGVGITLTRAGTLIRLERSWSMIENTQGEDRVHRIGSEIHDKILIIDVISSGTVEERQLEVLAGKDDRLEEVVQDGKMIELLKYLVGGTER